MYIVVVFKSGIYLYASWGLCGEEFAFDHRSFVAQKWNVDDRRAGDKISIFVVYLNPYGYDRVYCADKHIVEAEPNLAIV